VQALGRSIAVKAEAPEFSPFLDWVRSRQARSKRSGSSTNAGTTGVETATMAARRHFLRGLDDVLDPCSGGGTQAQRPGQGHRARASFPHADPGKLSWSSDLYAASHSIQEQVNYLIATAKHLKAAEAQIRPVCRVPV
jgi:hypothetical protein